MRLFQSTAGVMVWAMLTSGAGGELVVFENSNPTLTALEYYQIGDGISVVGQALDVTHDSFDQPAFGELPRGSFMIMWAAGQNAVEGDWVFMGPGFNTHIGRADELVDVIDPYSNHPVGYIAPEDFDEGGEIGESTHWADAWVTMHTSVSTAPSKGIHFVDESFVLGIRFELDGGLHYGFAEMARTGFVDGEPLSIGYRPVRWGFETTAGVAVPGSGTIGALAIGMCGMNRRRRKPCSA